MSRDQKLSKLRGHSGVSRNRMTFSPLPARPGTQLREIGFYRDGHPCFRASGAGEQPSRHRSRRAIFPPV